MATDAVTPLNLGVTGGALTIKAAAGARPVITNNDGTPPRVEILAGTQITGVWFGGSTDPINKPVNVYKDVTLNGCVFFGYYGALGMGSDGVRQVVTDCRFVNCGNGNLYHDIYVSNSSAGVGEGAQLLNGIHLGGQGYKLHCWHGPANVVLRKNFCHTGHAISALDGTGTISDNIFWGQSVDFEPFNWTSMQSGQITHNLTGNLIGAAGVMPSGTTVDNNSFVSPNQRGGPWGTNQHQYTRSDVATLCGVSADAIDAAITVLLASFGASVAAIQADASIPTNFALLAGVAQTWAAQP